MPAYILLILIWTGYFTFHSLLAAHFVKNRAEKSLGLSGKKYRMTYVLLSVILLIPLLWYTAAHQGNRLFEVSVWTQFIGLMLATYGVFIVREGFRYYHTPAFLGLANPELEQDKLVIEGLNRYVRHPLYAGTILIVLGLVVFLPTMTNLIVFILILIYTLIGIKLEEKKLVEQFGQEYEDYRKNVPMLIPKIFKR